MLSLLRRFSKSPLGLGVFALIIIAFVVTLYEGQGGFGGTSGAGGSVVTVGGDGIDEVELARRVDNQLQGEKQRDPTIDLPRFIANGGVEQTVDLTATGRALELFAEQQGMVASKRLIDGAIASIPAFNGPTGKFDRTTFLNILSQRKLNETMLRNDFAREALAKILAVPAAGGARVPAAVVQPYASLLLETRSGQVAALPSTSFLPTAQPTDTELQTYYQRNIARYTVPERRAIRFATFDKSRFVGKAAPTDAEIQQAYAADRTTYAARETRSFTQIILGTQAQAENVLAKVRGGMAMADAAKAEKRDALTVPATERAAFEQLTGTQVAAAAFAAPKGGLAAVARSGLGFHVVRVDSIAAIAATPLSAVRAKIVADLTTRKEVAAINTFVQQVEEALSANATFDEVAKKFGLTASVTPPVTADGRSLEAAATQIPPSLSAIFKDAFQAEIDDDPAVATLPDNAGYVLWKLDRTLPAAPKPLGELRPQVVADVQIDKGSKAAKAAADAIVAAVNAGTPIAAAVSRTGIRLPPLQTVNTRRLELAQAEGQVPPPLALLFAMPQKRARVLEIAGRRGWYVVYLDRIVGGDARTAPGLIEATQQQLSGAIGDEFVQQFAAAVRAEIGVKKNDAAIARLKKSLVGSAR